MTSWFEEGRKKQCIQWKVRLHSDHGRRTSKLGKNKSRACSWYRSSLFFRRHPCVFRIHTHTDKLTWVYLLKKMFPKSSLTLYSPIWREFRCQYFTALTQCPWQCESSGRRLSVWFGIECTISFGFHPQQLEYCSTLPLFAMRKKKRAWYIVLSAKSPTLYQTPLELQHTFIRCSSNDDSNRSGNQIQNQNVLREGSRIFSEGGKGRVADWTSCSVFPVVRYRCFRPRFFSSFTKGKMTPNASFRRTSFMLNHHRYGRSYKVVPCLSPCATKDPLLFNHQAHTTHV